MTLIANQAEVVRLLKKYALILVVFQVLQSILLTFVPVFLHSFYSVEEVARWQLTAIFFRVAGIALNLIVGLMILSEMDRKARLSWLIFIVALFLPSIAVVFLVITKMVDIGSMNADLNQDQTVLDYKLLDRSER